MQCVFFSRLWVVLKRSCFCGRVVLKRTSCLQQMFKMMPFCLHARTQSCCPVINGLVDDALCNASPCINHLLQSCCPVINGLVDDALCNASPCVNHLLQSCCPVINGLVDDALCNASPCINHLLLQVADVVISLQSKIK